MTSVKILKEFPQIQEALEAMQRKVKFDFCWIVKSIARKNKGADNEYFIDTEKKILLFVSVIKNAHY